MDDPVVTTVTTPTPTPTPEATPEATPTTTPTADETRRAVADARRKRILDKSKDRMGIVSGEQSKTTTTTTGEDGGAAVPVDEEPKPSGAARMNAMRRRRNLAKKKETVDTTTTETTPVKEESTTITSTTTTDDKKKEEPVVVAAAAVVKEEEPVVVVTPAPAAATPAAPTAATTDTTTPAPAEKKKYKGVAATRRQMLKDKAAKEQAARDESVTKAMTSSSSKPTAKKAASIPKFPIYMHLVTILILFSSGLYLGTTHVVQDHVTIHRELLAPQQHGVGVMRLFESLSNRIKGKSSTTSTTTLLQDEEWAATAQAGDEFGSEDDDDDTVHEPNIDPLFNLDLDKFTQGNSIMMMGARFAVGMHRMNLYFFYYLPLGIVKTLVSVPKKLMQTPPLLAIFAVVVRQFMKRVLGATLPDETVKSSKSKGDVLAMVKNGVVTFLTNSFPTVVGLYDAFTHLRSDMLILLCGIFVGLAWNHHSVVVGILTEHDEL